jgi:hypothetical protein
MLQSGNRVSQLLLSTLRPPIDTVEDGKGTSAFFLCPGLRLHCLLEISA